MNDDDNERSIVPVPEASLALAGTAAGRVLSEMVGETLALARREALAAVGEQVQARFKIGEYKWREADHRQILIWANALELQPEEVIRRLLAGNDPENPKWIDTVFTDGTILKLHWDFALLPLERFEWVAGLGTTQLAFTGTPRKPISLALRLPSLTALRCPAVGLRELDLTCVPMLTELWCSNNQLTEIDLSAVPMLTRLYCEDNQLRELDLSAVPMLTNLWCESNHLTKLDLSAVPVLTELSCFSNQLTEIDLSAVPVLTELWCGNNQLTEIDLSGVPVLTKLFCGENQLRELDLSNVTMLTHLQFNSMHFTDIDLSRVPMLTHLMCGSNQLKELDIRPLLNLEKLKCDFISTKLIQRPDQHFQ
jgi:Leucine-rich repeat (LRR) protein